MYLMVNDFFYLQLERMILKSIYNVVKTFGNVETTPKLKFKLHFEDCICISTPSLDDICMKYCSILDLVSIVKYISITFIGGLRVI